MEDNLNVYALLSGLERWLPQAKRSAFPAWIYQNASRLDPYLQRAEELILGGESIKFDPQNPKAATCIFNEVLVNESMGAEDSLSYPFRPLSLQKVDIFPGGEEGDYQDLCKRFVQDLSLLPGDQKNPKIYGESLFYLMKKYLWSIAVSETLPYMQLFEFLKVRAAVAQSLLAFEKAGESSPYQLQLYCVDQSGIQNFLYNIASSKAAKSLKGRSFYLQLLLETVIQMIANDAGIAGGSHNVLYASGGKMYLILPNTNSTNQALAEIELQLQQQLVKDHGYELYLATGKVLFGWDGRGMIFEDEKGNKELGTIANVWPLLADRTRRSSRQAYRGLLKDAFQEFFLPNAADGFNDSVGKKKVCAVTGETVAVEDPKDKDTRRRHDMLYHRRNEGDDPIWVSAIVKKQADLGYKLQQAKYYKVFYPEKFISDKHEPRLANPLNQGIYQSLAEENNIKDELEKLRQLHSFGFATIKKINDPTHFLPSHLHTTQQQQQSAYGFSFYGGNRQAFNEDLWKDTQNIRKAVKDYTQLAGITSDEDKHEGYHRLGVLRMDVDGLGKIFSEGMSQMQYLPAYATLSSQLDLFFSGYLNTIREESQELKDHLNIIYSGGDDIFVVGRWDQAIAFAERVRADFKSFVNHREEISISGGLVLVNPKFPIGKSASYAGEAEDLAKDFGRMAVTDEPQKNAICLFDMPISWKGEFEKVKQLKDQLIHFRQSSQLTAGFLQKMIDFQQVKDLHLREITKDKEPDLSFLWTSAFYVSRVQERFRKLAKTAPIRVLLSEIKQEFFTAVKNQGRFYDLLAVAARWAELELRMKAIENQK